LRGRVVRRDGLRTGDAGYLDENGYIYIQGRFKNMIVSGGENFYPSEVESAIYGHPAVADVAVIGVPDERWGEAVKAIVVLRPGRSRMSRASSPSPGRGSPRTKRPSRWASLTPCRAILPEKS
jgi:acyl-CoA synthetase (AMP-forming)/AMP-acid ligase II